MIKIDPLRPKKALILIILTVFNFIMILGAADWHFTPLAFLAIAEIILAFKKLKHRWITRGLILFMLIGLQFITILWAAGWDFTPIVMTALANVIVAFEKIECADVSDDEIDDAKKAVCV